MYIYTYVYIYVFICASYNGNKINKFIFTWGTIYLGSYI